jgi:hypothetical protein
MESVTRRINHDRVGNRRAAFFVLEKEVLHFSFIEIYIAHIVFEAVFFAITDRISDNLDTRHFFKKWRKDDADRSCPSIKIEQMIGGIIICREDTNGIIKVFGLECIDLEKAFWLN